VLLSYVGFSCEESWLEWNVSKGENAVDNAKADRLAHTIAALHQQWGTTALLTLAQKAKDAHTHKSPTGFALLDTALEGGIAHGTVTQLCGEQTSGKGTLALRIIAASQERGEKAIYVDPLKTLNPTYAAACGVCLEDLLIVRPVSYEEGLDIATQLVRLYGVGVIVIAHTPAKLAQVEELAVQRLVHTVRCSPSACIILSRFASPLHAVAKSRIEFRRLRWIRRHGVVCGYIVRLTVAKHNGREMSRKAILRIDLDEAKVGCW
jgi:hypothetical protein